MNRRTLLLAAPGVALAAAGTWSDLAAQQQATKLAAGLEASVDFMGRDKRGATLTVNLRLTNKSPTAVSVLLVGYPEAIDNGGMRYNLQNLSGVTHCVFDANICSGRGIGMPADLDTYTQLDPVSDATINMTFLTDQGTAEGKGPLASVSAVLLYRVIRDPAQDERMSEDDRRRGLRTMNLSIRNHPVTQAR